MPTVEEKPVKHTMNKTAFVLSLPAKMPARKVAERARRQGMVISEKYVYVVRSNARRKAGKRRGPGRPAGARGPTGAPSEREFRRLVLDLGVKKAEQLLADTKKGVQEIIAGK